MNAEKLFRLLKEHKVDFVIIGATAFPVYGYARATFDIDIFIRPSEENVEKAWKALKEFGYDMTDISLEDLMKKKLLIRQYALETDIHPFVKGVSFEDVWNNKVRKKFGNTFVYFASLDDLIKMKRAAGRSKDLEDLKILQSLKRLKYRKAQGKK
jgi:predicted nucleotidyltransferase